MSTKTIRPTNELSIWLSCSIVVLIMTAAIILVYKLYGIVAILELLVISECFLQLYKKVYEIIARRKVYGLSLIKSITNCWTIYIILNTTLCTGGLYTYLLLLAENNTCGIPKRVYCIVILVFACVFSLIPIQRFVKNKSYSGKKRNPAKLISSFVPRFVILYTFVVYYFIAYVNSLSSSDIIPALCVVYIGIERLISMFQTISVYSKQEYYSLFRDTVKWIRKLKHLD